MRMMPAAVLVGLLLGVDLASQALAESPAARVVSPDGTRFSAGVDLVTFNVVVTDARQRIVSGLPADAFEVIEDGVVQRLTFVATDSVATDLAVVADTSSSMADKMTNLKVAATGFLGIVRPGDRVLVVGVTDRSTVIHALREPPGDAAAAIWRARAGGNTVLYNGIYLAINQLAREGAAGEVRHQVLTVFSDGQDTNSIVAFDDVLEQAKRVGLSVYTVLLQTPAVTKGQRLNRDRANAVFAMKNLARETGGRAYFPTTMTEVPEIYRTIAADVAGRYTLGYVSTNTVRDGRYRRVHVRMRGLPAQARTRTGYYAAAVDSE